MAAGSSDKRDGRLGLGDDQGTRVGRPDPALATPAEGDQSRDASRPTGMGGEAAEGIHDAGAGDRSQGDTSGVAADRADEGTKGRAGSEPVERTKEHRSGYGGSGGRPVTSSDQREPQRPDR